MSNEIELRPIHLSEEAFTRLPAYKQEVIDIWNRQVSKLKEELEKKKSPKPKLVVESNYNS